MLGLLLLTVAASAVLATPVVYDGRVPFSFPGANLDSSTGPFLTWALHFLVANLKTDWIRYVEWSRAQSLQPMYVSLTNSVEEPL